MKRIVCLIMAACLLLSFAGCKKTPQASSSASFSSQTASSSSLISSEASSTVPSETHSETSTPSKNESSKKPQVSSSAPTVSATEKEPEKWYTRGEISISSNELNAVLSQKYQKAKNVILVIGDGMGLNDLELVKRYNRNLFEFGLVVEKLPHKGTATTHNIKSELTDSAAAATALATGQKTKNSVLGVDVDGNEIKNASETARENGKKVGIVTSDSVTGATPSGFTIHNTSRADTSGIAASFIDFAPDVLIGDSYGDFYPLVNAAQNAEKMSRIALANTFDTFESQLNANAKKPFFGFADFDLNRDIYQLAYCTEIALKKLENEKGFFLMVESCGPDKGGHENNIMKKLTGVASLERVVVTALKFCAKNPDTVLIVTSDHETGGVVIPESDDLTTSPFTTTNHTGVDVGVFAIGYGTEIFNAKAVDNTDIAKFVLNTLSGKIS